MGKGECMKPEVTHKYWITGDASMYYHEKYQCLHIVTNDGDLDLENIPLKMLKDAIKNRCKA